MVTSKSAINSDRKSDAFVRAFDLLEDFEKKANPYRFFYQDFPVWLALRQSIYLLLVNELAPSSNLDCGSISRSKKMASLLRLLLVKARYINRALIFNLKRIRNKYMVCSAEIARKKIGLNEDINIFIDPLRTLHEDVQGVEFISHPHFQKSNDRYHTLKAFDLYLLRSIAFGLKPMSGRLLRRTFAFDDKVKINLSKIGITNKTLEILINNFINDFEFITCYWNFIFKYARPKIVASIDWYSVGNMLMIYSANKHNIPTIELVHGLINREHIGYIFKNVEESNRLSMALPQYVITHGKLQKDIMLNEGTLWTEEHLLDMGFPWLEYFLKHITIKKDELKKKLKLISECNILTITSQEPLQSVLNDMLLQLEIPVDWHVVIKLHPAEVRTWEHGYSGLLKKDGLSFVNDNQISFYELLAISNAHASFYSSTLWEAPFFGVSNYIIDYSTKHMVDDIVKLGLAKVSTLQKIFHDDFKPINESIEYVFSNSQGGSAKKIIEFFAKVSSKE
jgi:hypothetical protein